MKARKQQSYGSQEAYHINELQTWFRESVASEIVFGENQPPSVVNVKNTLSWEEETSSIYALLVSVLGILGHQLMRNGSKHRSS